MKVINFERICNFQDKIAINIITDFLEFYSLNNTIKQFENECKIRFNDE